MRVLSNSRPSNGALGLLLTLYLWLTNLAPLSMKPKVGYFSVLILFATLILHGLLVVARMAIMWKVFLNGTWASLMEFRYVLSDILTITKS